MLDRAKRLSSSPDLFSKECYDLRKMFLKLKYPVKLINSIFMRFHAPQDLNQSCIEPIDSPVFDNDDMSSPKRHVFISLLFIHFKIISLFETGVILSRKLLCKPVNITME